MIKKVCTASPDSQGRAMRAEGVIEFPIDAYEENLEEQEVQWHWHDELEFVHVITGEAEATVGNCKYKLATDTVLFINAGALHTIKEEKRCTIRSLVFHPRLIGGTPDSIYQMSLVEPIISNATLQGRILQRKNLSDRIAMEAMIDAWDAMALDNAHTPLLVRDRLTWLLYHLIEQQSDATALPTQKEIRDDVRLKQMLSYIHANYSEAISTKSIAAAATISESECLRCFRGRIGMPPIRYLKQYRLQQAASLLRNTTRKINDIADRCGFQEMSYFAKSFKSQYGITPQAYRKKEE